MTSAAVPCHPVTAAVLLTDHLGRVLLVRPIGWSRTWQLPGGIVEAGESPREAGRREVREELGLDVQPGALLAVEWIQTRTPGRRNRLAFVFDAPALDPGDTARVTLQRGELAAWRMEPAAGVRRLLHPLIAARLPDPRRGRTLYLETRNPERTPTA